MSRWGITIPLDGMPTHEQVDALVDAGYTDFWTGETAGVDGFTPLALTAAYSDRARVGTAVVPAFTRAPATMAQSVAGLALAAPGRFAFGIGCSSDIIVSRWNGVPFERPLTRTRDMVLFLKEALTGAKITERYETFAVDGFRLATPPEEPPPILVAALREKMLRMAGSVGDGAILNWLSADDVRTVAPYVHAGGPGKEIACRIFVCPSEDAEVVRAAAKFAVAAYLNVPVYADFHRWLGRTEQLQPMWDAWSGGDRKAAVAAIPDEVVDELVVHGPAETCRRRIQEYFANGVTTSSLAVLPLDANVGFWDAVRLLAPSAG
jgi:probable F420-dependent oxidoreductase